MAKLWGGRFEKEDMIPFVMKFTSSIEVDKILAYYDCLSTKVHVEMLHKTGLITEKEKKEFLPILEQLLQKIEKGTFNPEAFEDIHSAVQDYVSSRAPELAKKLHTGRSRNEQVVNDVRLYCKDHLAMIEEAIISLQKALVVLAEKNFDVIIPGYTHLNRAQPILFSHLTLAYVEMLQRDLDRVKDAYKRTDVSVMGSGALAGAALELDRKFIADKLGFQSISANSIDAVSDRDFIVEIVSALCFIAVHLSRIAEDMILYSTPEFGFLDIGESYCTGSSLMPQKKNPDVLELIRGRSSVIIGYLNTLFVLLKALPHSYNRDLQEDKKPLFESMRIVADELAIMKDLVGTLKLKKSYVKALLEDEFIYATDIAEYLVRKGVAFKDAHDIAGSIIKKCIKKDINISDMSIAELKKISDKIDEDIFDLLNAETSVKNKKTPGSTNPAFVKKEIESWKKKLKKQPE
ncbi:MAG: argininosuccinate lyase [Candidatus Omnitrophica bacterium]|nr:argininosuccinate lyase [Candidatus Omnitrophota bacterium]